MVILWVEDLVPCPPNEIPVPGGIRTYRDIDWLGYLLSIAINQINGPYARYISCLRRIKLDVANFSVPSGATINTPGLRVVSPSGVVFARRRALPGTP
jgi:hypothetical protein